VKRVKTKKGKEKRSRIPEKQRTHWKFCCEKGERNRKEGEEKQKEIGSRAMTTSRKGRESAEECQGKCRNWKHF